MGCYRALCFLSQVTPKPTRSLRATRRMATEDSADELTRPDTPTGVAAGTAARSSDVASRKRKASGIPQRFLKRERVHCPHQQVTGVQGVSGESVIDCRDHLFQYSASSSTTIATQCPPCTRALPVFLMCFCVCNTLSKFRTQYFLQVS